MSDDVLNGVIACVAESFVLKESELSSSTKLVSELDADSLDIMDLMFQLEEKFDIKMEKDDFNFFKKIDMTKEDAVIDEFLTDAAKNKLKVFLPELDTSIQLKPVDLTQYLSISSLVKLVNDYKDLISK